MDTMNTEGHHDAEWVQEAVSRHSGSLVRYAAHLTGDPDRARDIVQDTFLKLCAVDRAKVDGHLPEWLFTVCRNRALDVMRKEKRMKPFNETDLATRADEMPSPAFQAEQHETAGEILGLIGGLPSNQQEVIRLKFQNGLSYKEISRVTSLTVSNVGFLIHTAVKALRKGMAEPPSLPGNERRIS